MSLDWIESNGGPLILLENRLLSHWEGTDPPSGGRVVEATFRWQGRGPATDYDRACDVRDRLGIVPSATATVSSSTTSRFLRLAASRYRIDIAYWRPDDLTALVLIRFSPQS